MFHPWILCILLTRMSSPVSSYFICLSVLSVTEILSFSVHFSLSYFSLACLHLFLISLCSVLYSVLYLDIVFCLFFIMSRISSVIHYFFVYFSLVSQLLVLLKLLLMSATEFPFSLSFLLQFW